MFCFYWEGIGSETQGSQSEKVKRQSKVHFTQDRVTERAFLGLDRHDRIAAVLSGSPS